MEVLEYEQLTIDAIVAILESEFCDPECICADELVDEYPTIPHGCTGCRLLPH